MIGAMIVGLARSFTDVLLAGWHIVSLQRRNRYTSKIDIAVPPERVWDLITRRNVTYTALNMRYEQIPIEGREDLIVQSIKVGDRDLGRVGYEEIERTPPCLAVRYLAEHSDRPDRFGSDDVCAMCVHDGPNGGARFSVARELTHLTAATRIAAPIGVRMATHMVKLQAEHEAGIKPIAPGSSLVQAGLQQLMWTVAAIASFWLMFGWRDALVMAVVVAVHEAGHALAMLRYGLGVRIISFIPFFGGVAAPKRYYADQWQRGMVALAGVGFSLLPTLVLLAAAQQFESAEAAHWAALSAFINGFNLLPVPGLDGSIVTQLLLRPRGSRVLRGPCRIRGHHQRLADLDRRRLLARGHGANGVAQIRRPPAAAVELGRSGPPRTVVCAARLLRLDRHGGRPARGHSLRSARTA